MNKVVVALVVIALIAMIAWVYAPHKDMTPSIHVTMPASGATLVEGATQTIRWESMNVPATHSIAISIRRIPPPSLQEEGQEFDPLIFTGLPNTGAVEWTVSDMYSPGSYVLGITAYEATPVTNPITAESAAFEIVEPLPQDLLPLYNGATWGAPHLYPLDIPEGPLYGTAVEAEAAKGTMNPADAFSPFYEYYQEKLKKLGWEVDISLEAGGPMGGQTVYRKGNDFVAVNFHTTFHVHTETAPSECPCDVRLVLFVTKRPVQ